MNERRAAWEEFDRELQRLVDQLRLPLVLDEWGMWATSSPGLSRETARRVWEQAHEPVPYHCGELRIERER